MTGPIRHVSNRWRQHHRANRDGSLAADLRAMVRNDPDYAPSPVVNRPHDARDLRLGALWIKNEGARLAAEGLGSFKPVGVMGAFAHLARQKEHPAHVVCASDGNFGRAVAWGAARARIAATIVLPSTVSPARVAAIESFGARATLVAGGYDAAMALSAKIAATTGALELTDTGHTDATLIPQIIQHSYGVIAEECVDQISVKPPTHVLVPAGVGGFAAGLISAFDDKLGSEAPRVISVQPHLAGSIPDSLLAKQMTSVPEIKGTAQDPPTRLVGLACETLSTTAWPVLRDRLADALSISDDVALDGLRRLAHLEPEPSIVAGESGAAAYGALVALCQNDALRRDLQLSEASRVLVLVTETATDPGLYQRILRDG